MPTKPVRIKPVRIKAGRIDAWDVCLCLGSDGDGDGFWIEYGPMIFARAVVYGEPRKRGWEVQGPYPASDILAIFALLAPHIALLEQET